MRLVAALAVLLCIGCQSPLAQLKPVLKEEGEVFLYLEPLAQGGGATSSTLSGIAAVRNDGVEVPLTVRLPELAPGGLKRQRLLASGVVPQGSYRGLVSYAKKAVVRTPEGTATVALSGNPERTDFPFEVRHGKGTVLSLTLSYKKVPEDEVTVVPVFACAVKPRPLPLVSGYVTNTAANTITVFDKMAGSVREVIETGQGPKGIVLDPVLLKAYVAISGGDMVQVVDILTNEIINRVQLTYNDRPSDIALTPNGKLLLVVNTGSNTVSFVDTVNLVEQARVGVDLEPVALLLAPSGTTAYVFNHLSNTISVLDIATKTVTGTIPTEQAPLRGAFTKRGERLMVFHEWSPYLMVFDPTTFALDRKLHVGMGVSALKVDGITETTYLGRRGSPTLDLYPPFDRFRNDFPTDFLKGGGVGTNWMIFDADTNDLFLLHPEERSLERINVISKKEVFRIDVDGEPYRATIMGER